MIFLNGKKMDDVLPLRTIEDDIMYQKIKTLPKQSRHYRVHRRLTWQCNKDIQHLEKSNRLATVELDRSKCKVISKLQEIRTRRQDIISSGRHSRLLLRKHSVPFLSRENDLKNSRDSSCRIRAKSIPNLKDLDGTLTTGNSTPLSEFSRIFGLRREVSEMPNRKHSCKQVTIVDREKTFAFEHVENPQNSFNSGKEDMKLPPKNILGVSPEPPSANSKSSRRFTLPIIRPLPAINSVS